MTSRLQVFQINLGNIWLLDTCKYGSLNPKIVHTIGPWKIYVKSWGPVLIIQLRKPCRIGPSLLRISLLPPSQLLLFKSSKLESLVGDLQDFYRL